MQEITNKEMIKGNGFYSNPLVFNKGFVVIRAYGPREYIAKDNKKSDAWLPDIMVFSPTENSLVSVEGAFIVAKSPTKISCFYFNPSWNKQNNSKEIIFTFKNSFKKANNDLGNLAVKYFNLTSYGDKNITPGSIPYTGIGNRDITLYGSKNELEKMLSLAVQKFPNRSDNLKFSAPCCATSNEEYSIEIKKEDAKKCIAKITERIK